MEAALERKCIEVSEAVESLYDQTGRVSAKERSGADHYLTQVFPNEKEWWQVC